MKVLIPSAGIGSRLGDLTRYYNKAMVSLGKRPIISHIMDTYPANTEFVIALGYKGDYLRQYLELAYPQARITFVEVDRYEGPGTGLGYTLKKCSKYLDSEFVFHANDSIIVDDRLRFPMETDTMLLARGTPDPKNYRTVSFDGESELVTAIHDKTDAQLRNVYKYIGVAYVKRYEDFVELLRDISVEIGESHYFMRVLDKGVKAYVVDQWYDIGSLEQLHDAEAQLSDFETLPKPREAIYFKGNKVYKFSTDTEFIEKRVARAEQLNGLVPEIVARTENFYVYNYVPGTLLSDEPSVTDSFRALLRWAQQNLWIPTRPGPKEQQRFENACFSFYYDKTVDRLNAFYEQHEVRDTEETINGVVVPSLHTLLDSFDWSGLKRGVPALYHGDFHFENIVRHESGFTLLDWRQDFGESDEYGDLYYDLGKLLHGLIVSHQIIRDSLFTVQVRGSRVVFDFNRRNTLVECELILKEFVRENSYSWQKVNLVAALIFLNIAALHHYPYSHLLYYLGKSMFARHIGQGAAERD